MYTTRDKSTLPEVSTRDYEFTHGKKPRGEGCWAFCPTHKYRDPNYLDHVKWFQGLYGKAKREAQEYFKDHVDSLTVCT